MITLVYPRFSILADVIFPGVFASILGVIRDRIINIEEIENVIFEGGIAACCTMKLKTGAAAEMLKKIQDNTNVLSVSHMAL